jgi:predicted aspartyl protease/uncharacterized protein YukE
VRVARRNMEEKSAKEMEFEKEFDLVIAEVRAQLELPLNYVETEDAKGLVWKFTGDEKRATKYPECEEHREEAELFQRVNVKNVTDSSVDTVTFCMSCGSKDTEGMTLELLLELKRQVERLREDFYLQIEMMDQYQKELKECRKSFQDLLEERDSELKQVIDQVQQLRRRFQDQERHWQQKLETIRNEYEESRKKFFREELENKENLWRKEADKLAEDLNEAGKRELELKRQIQEVRSSHEREICKLEDRWRAKVQSERRVRRALEDRCQKLERQIQSHKVRGTVSPLSKSSNTSQRTPVTSQHHSFGRRTENSKPPLRCHYCRKKGHPWKFCRRRMNDFSRHRQRRDKTATMDVSTQTPAKQPTPSKETSVDLQAKVLELTERDSILGARELLFTSKPSVNWEKYGYEEPVCSPLVVNGYDRTTWKGVIAEIKVEQIQDEGIQVEGCYLHSLIDTGSAISGINNKLFRVLFPKVQLKRFNHRVVTANNTWLEIVGQTPLRITVGKTTKVCNVLVVKNLQFEFLLGMDALKSLGLTVDCVAESLCTREGTMIPLVTNQNGHVTE